MKRIVTAALLLLSLTAGGKGKRPDGVSRITFGAEWNYIASFNCRIHNNFFSDIGYRVDMNDNTYDFKSNADLYLHCGFNLSEDWNISVYSGIAGVYSQNKIIPVSLRATRYFRPDSRGDRWFTFMDGGSGISVSRHPQAVGTGKIGGGYRISMSPASKLDFLIALRMTLNRPEIEYDGFEIPIDKINRNNAYVNAVSAGISLTF